MPDPVYRIRMILHLLCSAVRRKLCRNNPLLYDSKPIPSARSEGKCANSSAQKASPASRAQSQRSLCAGSRYHGACLLGPTCGQSHQRSSQGESHLCQKQNAVEGNVVPQQQMVWLPKMQVGAGCAKLLPSFGRRPLSHILVKSLSPSYLQSFCFCTGAILYTRASIHNAIRIVQMVQGSGIGLTFHLANRPRELLIQQPISVGPIHQMTPLS